MTRLTMAGLVGAALLAGRSTSQAEIILHRAKIEASVNGTTGGPRDTWQHPEATSVQSATQGGSSIDAAPEFSIDGNHASLGGVANMLVGGGTANCQIFCELEITVVGEETDLSLLSEMDGSQLGNDFYAQLSYDVLEYDVSGPLIGWVVSPTIDSSSDASFALSQSRELTLQPGSRYLIRIQQNLYGQDGSAIASLGIRVGATDTDGDGFPDGVDAFPENPSEWVDSDGDGTGDNSDLFPNDPTEQADSDGDGTGDNADEFPTSITAPTIEVGKVLIENLQLENGAWLADEIDFALSSDLSTAELVAILVEMKADGLISGREMGQILREHNTG